MKKGILLFSLLVIGFVMIQLLSNSNSINSDNESYSNFKNKYELKSGVHSSAAKNASKGRGIASVGPIKRTKKTKIQTASPMHLAIKNKLKKMVPSASDIHVTPLSKNHPSLDRVLIEYVSAKGQLGSYQALIDSNGKIVRIWGQSKHENTRTRFRISI